MEKHFETVVKNLVKKSLEENKTHANSINSPNQSQCSKDSEIEFLKNELKKKEKCSVVGQL